MKDGGWLNKYQEGGEASKYIQNVPKTFGRGVAASESTGVNKVLPTDPRKLKLINQAEEDAKIAKERRARINKSISPEALDFNKPSEDLALQTSATADKLRFSDYPNWFDDSMLNPIPTLAPMVSGLGRIPLEISQGNYGQAAWNLAAPVLAGAGEAAGEMLLKPVIDPLMAYGKTAAKKYVLTPAMAKLNSILGRQASVPSMGPYMRPSHVIDDLSGTNIGRNINQDFGIDQLLADNSQLADQFKLPLYEPGSGSGILPQTAKTSKDFKKLIYDKNLTHLYQRSKLMHGCGSAAECAQIANAIASTVNRQVTPDVPFDYSGNADNAWYSTSQMLRNDGELIYNEGRDGLINSNIASKLQVGDQVMMGPDAGTPHPSVSSATGNIKEPNVNHRATIVGTDSDGNMLLNESFDGRLVSVPIQNNVYYNNNSNYGIRSIVRPSQFVDKAQDIAKRAILNDVNMNTGTMDFGVSPELQMYKELYDKVKPRLIGNLGIHADEADQIFRHILGIGVQETKMSGKLAKGLPKAKVIIQDKLREAGLTKPVKEMINAVKAFGNRKYEPNPDLLDFPGKSTIQMEASKLAEKEGIDVIDAVEQLYTTKYNRPKPFALSDTDPSVGAFRQKHLSKTAERLGLTEKDFKIGKGNKNSFYNNPENEILGAFSNFYDLKNSLAKKHPDWNQQKLFDMATLSWNSPSKANNAELVDYFYDFVDNSKFEGFDYLNKVKNNIKTYAPLKSVTPTSEVNITKPFLQFKDGGWLDQYQEGGELDKSALSGVKNVLSAVSDITSAPARGLTYLATGKYQDPSQAMGITNPIGAFLTDAILDPANLVGAGLATKVLKGAGKVNKVARAVDVADRIANTNTFQRMGIAPKNIPIDPKQFKQASQSTIDALTQRGQELDKITNGKFNVTPDDIHYHGTFAARPIVEVKTPHGSEYFYKSTGWGGKKGIDPGQWQAFGQWMDAPAGTVAPTAINNWFVKGKGFDNFYGSKSFGNVANSLDDALIKKYNVPPKDINKFLNFQNIQSDVNTFIPKRKDGGWLEKYEDGGELNYNDSNASAGPGFQGDGYSNVGRNYSPAWGGQFQDGGEIAQTGKTVPFEQWYKTVPKTKNDTTSYNLRRAYELAPQKDLDSFVKNPKAHLMSAYEDPNTGIYEFMKSKNHPTIQKELDWYNSKQGADFKNSHSLDTSGNYYKYIPKEMAMGGSMPGAVGFTYARVAGSAPDNGKYAKKTKASAKNGTEMEYYQNGLDWKPRNISKNGKKVIKDDRGQWDHPGEITQIGSNQITMQGVPYPVMGISDTGDIQMMYPNQDYQYDGKSVTEYPMMAQGGQLTKLDQLTNFTNYNKPTKGGWLDKYK